MNKARTPNHLASETSPYLRQHQYNPVDWYPWGREAFEKAKLEDKPIFLSIGYSTCYWCHVMEKDSFEKESVAEVLNSYFVCIKVDREERPDIDQIYMDAVVALTGHGGWPMSVWLTPELEPFYGATFFYEKQFLSVLDQIQRAWAENRPLVGESASKISKFLQEKVLPAGDEDGWSDPELFPTIVSSFSDQFDEVWGGFGAAPKFPQAVALSLLLRAYKKSKNVEPLRMAEKTLQSMARGGIYDHLGGGFSRYSTDEKWLVPHFEKMLYDNSLLAVTYLEAYQITETLEYREVASDTLNFILTEMKSPDGGFYSALDAGEVDAEGEYYVWLESEIQSTLSPSEWHSFKKLFSVTAHGNFEHGHNILSIADGFSWDNKLTPEIKSARAKLLAKRLLRKRPHLDDKILTAWNGLAISALAKGYQILGDNSYLDAAKSSASFILGRLYKEGALLRSYCGGEARHAGCLDDYTYLIEALLNLYESDFDVKWFDLASSLQETQDRLFWDESESGYFFSHAAEVIVKRKDLIDNATPSGNGVALNNLARLSLLSGEGRYREKALALQKVLSPVVAKYPAGAAKALHAAGLLSGEGSEIAVLRGNGENFNEFLRLIWQSFLPDKVLAAGGPGGDRPELLSNRDAVGGKTTLYICKNRVCRAPLTEIGEASEAIDHI